MGLFDKSDIYGFTDNSDLDMKIATQVILDMMAHKII